MSQFHVPFEIDRPNHRPARYAQRVREELTELVPGSLKDPRLFGVTLLTITNVELSADYKHATVSFCMICVKSTERQAVEVTEALNSASTFLRRELMHRMGSKITPHLRFVYDKGPERAEETEALFKELQEADAERSAVE